MRVCSQLMPAALTRSSYSNSNNTSPRNAQFDPNSLEALKTGMSTLRYAVATMLSILGYHFVECGKIGKRSYLNTL